jgi:hypothetical protein
MWANMGAVPGNILISRFWCGEVTLEVCPSTFDTPCITQGLDFSPPTVGLILVFLFASILTEKVILLENNVEADSLSCFEVRTEPVDILHGVLSFEGTWKGVFGGNGVGGRNFSYCPRGSLCE